MLCLGGIHRRDAQCDALEGLVPRARRPDHAGAHYGRHRCGEAEGKTGIILGWQNLTGIEDQIGYLGLFKELGVGIMQIAYNTQNLVGTGCYEGRDGGLSDFGHEVIAEMNRLGDSVRPLACWRQDKRGRDRASTQPVAYTHCLPAGLKAHPRNKSDEQLRFIADRGGFVGVTMFPPFLNAACIER